MSFSQNKLTPRDWMIVVQISCMFSFTYNLGAVMASRQAQGQESLSIGFAYILMSLSTLLIGVVGPSLQLIGSPILLRVSTLCARRFHPAHGDTVCVCSADDRVTSEHPRGSGGCRRR